MNTQPLHLYSPAAVRAMDAHAIGELGIDGYVLMTRAGQAAFEAMRSRWPEARCLRVVCGTGNNGGDGYVVARLARAAGLEVQLLQLGDPARLGGDALRAASDWRAAGGGTTAFDPERLGGADLIVDAIFGTGLDRPLEGEWAQAVAAINAAGKPVMALDIPSGLHGETGAVLGEAVRASLTVTFIAAKSGLYTGAGPACVGEVVLDDLDVPPEVLERQPPHSRLVGLADLRALLPPRPRDSHKGQFGHVLVIGGDLGFGGAARMAAEAAARSGAGLVSVATREQHVSALLAARPELMVRGVQTTAELEPLLQRATVVAVGPGLGTTAWGSALFQRALEFTGPLVLDADALNLLARAPRRRDNWILTPHPGEAARLLGTSATEIQRDRFAALKLLCERYGGTVLLKGAGTIVGQANEYPLISTTGNPGMSSGGMGDVLTGIVAGLLAQGAPALEAAAVAAYVHGAAADLAATAGERGLLALDLLPSLQSLVNPG